MIADNYIRVDRSIDPTSKFIEDMAREIIKIMIFYEQKYLNNPLVIDSIKQFSYLFAEQPEKEQDPTLDDILDKINEQGIKSLTHNELLLLEKLSGNS